MTTNVTVIGDSLRLLGVIGEGDTVSAEQGPLALRALNQMMADWEGIEEYLGYFPQSSTTDTIPIPAWAEKGVTSKLAQRLSADYPSAQAPQWLWNLAENGIGTIERKHMKEKMRASRMDHLPTGEGHFGGRSRILTDG